MRNIMIRESFFLDFVDMEKAFDRIPKKVMEWAMRKKELREVSVKSVMSLSCGSWSTPRISAIAIVVCYSG